MLESKSGVLFMAGIVFFVLAFLFNGLIPWMMYARTPEETVEQTIEKQLRAEHRKTTTNLDELNKIKVHRQTVMVQFKLLSDFYHESFKKQYPRAEEWKKVEQWTREEREAKPGEWKKLKQETDEEKIKAAAASIKQGRDVYIAEGCWHCHSQFIRPIANEEKRWGPASKSWEYQNELQRPVMFGTRRVGPDLSREGGRRSNDWHAAHFFRPRDTSPQSVMPEYPWFFAGDAGHPNERGFAIILYMQWLGSWHPQYPDYGGS